MSRRLAWMASGSTASSKAAELRGTAASTVSAGGSPSRWPPTTWSGCAGSWPPPD